ncbi:putative transcription factor MYB-HB-like family [Helianthus debilis subsp. tardiflorus]
MTAKASILRITYSNELLEGGELQVSSNCLPVKASRFEPAGHSFHDVALKLCGCFMDEKKEVEETDESVPKEKDQDFMQSSGSYSSGKGKKKSGDGANQQDHYALLGLGNLRYLATDDQIRKSYREVALKHHPDKQASLLLLEETEAAKQSKKDEIENHFKAIQEAYEVLIDPVKRRVFDSTDEFDDEIPTDCGPQDFFKVFGPAFLRNGRWSVTQPTPLLGDENTPLDDVDLFYDFWYGFKSWREFPHDDEYDLEDAESLAEEERRKKEEDEKQAAEAAAQQKKIKEKEKKLLRKERSRLRTVSTNVVDQRLLDLNQDDVENLCMSLDVLKLKSLCDDMETQEECVQAELLKKALDNLDPSEKDNNNNIAASSQRNGSVKVNGNVQKQKKEKPWAQEEIELLRKGMLKYPKGTSRRWEVISEYIGTHRQVDEILKATKTVLLQKPDPTKAFDTFLEKKKPSQPISSPPTTQEENKRVEVNQNKNEVVENGVKSGVENGTNSDSDEWSVGQVTALIQALKTFPKEANQRWERIAAAVPGKTVNQCKKQFTLLKDKFKTKKK